ncbi:hypothetical protein [Streptomyces chartreusis]|uniref:hypothetical protein n=1 Tax=Streptomyces chartreusis TaxID=1969 RepID=UPI0037DCC899|nr:hypothetical protein OG938_48505 [Streptomyces chartreusis]
MHAKAQDLQEMAHFISCYGLNTGPQMAYMGPVITFDISALAYVVTEGTTPDVFFTDEVASIQLIEASDRAMACLRAISDVLDSAVCETRTGDGTWVPDYIEHVSNWAATPPIGATEPPTESEVIGRILRAANHAQTHAA